MERPSLHKKSSLKLLYFLAFLLLYACAFSQTYVGGYITSNTVWDSTGNPYVLNSDLTIQEEITLTILPGSEIIFPRPSYGLIINGTILAQGTDSDSIRFFGNDSNPNNHGGVIQFNKNSENSVLEYVTIEKMGDANTSFDASLALFTSSVAIRHCLIKDNESHGIYIGDNISPTIQNNRIEKSENAGIYIPGLSQPLIEENRFHNNAKDILIHPQSLELAIIRDNNLSFLHIIGTTIESSTTWPVSNDGFYQLDKNITVASGATLTIEAGADVSFSYNNLPYSSSILIDGSLVAVGTAQDSIRFFGNDSNPNAHGGVIQFNKNSVNSVLEYVAIEKMGDENTYFDASLALFASSVTIRHCLIKDNESHGIYIGDNISPTIQNNRIEKSEDAGIYISGLSQPLIEENRFHNNAKDILIHPQSLELAIIRDNNLSLLHIIGTTIESSTTWPVSNDGLYQLDGSVTVASEAILTIEPGVEVALPYYTRPYSSSIFINGSLLAIGTAKDSIRFFGNDSNPNAHGGVIQFNNSSANSILEYVSLEKMGDKSTSHDASIAVFSPSVTIRNCLIAESEYYGIYVGKIALSPQVQTDLIIQGNKFVNNEKDIICHPQSLDILNIYNNNLSILHINGTTIDSSTTWPKSIDGLYKLEGSMTVANNATLTIKPGVQLSFPYSSNFLIDGTLIASASIEDSIRFFGNNPDSNIYGGMIQLNSGSSNSIFEYVTIQRMGNYGKAVNILTPSVVLRNSRITKSKLYGIYSGTDTLNITNCLIDNNDIGLLINKGSPNLNSPNIFKNNELSGIKLVDCKKPNISNQLFERNKGTFGAIQIENTSDLMMDTSNVFIENSWPLSMDANSNLSKNIFVSDSGNVINGVNIYGALNEREVIISNIGTDYFITVDDKHGRMLINNYKILEGTRIFIKSGKGLLVEGYFEASGSEENPVLFSGMDSTRYWTGINFSPEALGKMDNCIMEYASTAITSHGEIFLTNTTIAKNFTNGISLIDSTSSKSLIEDCTIKNNGQKGIHCLQGAAPTIRWNKVIGNNFGITCQEAQPLIKFNHLYENMRYDLENIGSNTVDATQNFWGEATTEEMEDNAYPSDILKICDFYDNNDYGMVEYNNWLTNEPALLSVSPNSIANAGTHEITIRGNGFQPGAEVVITKDGYQDILPIETTFADSSKIMAIFDFDGRQMGSWDVNVENPREDALVLYDGISIGEGYVNLWVDIVGRSQIRSGRKQTYFIQIGNSGNINENLGHIFISTSKEIEFDINNKDSFLTLQENSSINLFILNLSPNSFKSIPFTIIGPSPPDTLRISIGIISDIANIFELRSKFEEKVPAYYRNFHHLKKLNNIEDSESKIFTE
ncbi:MAG: hypothetical protein GF353_24480, partial [Candidatus Lokiarchaeota archaeon]|nr:hypothetical protein [Candidatus Lokiarchaeota archaeon]